MNSLVKQIVESKFNFNIDIDVESNVQGNTLSKSKCNLISQMASYEINQYLVDLELPSGTKWCRYNLGVDYNQLEIPKDWYGDYYAWGETETKVFYKWNDYKYTECVNDSVKLFKYCNSPKYGYKRHIDDLTQLELEDDVAYQNFHIDNLKFIIPSKDQFKELKDCTTSEWVENYHDVEGLNGRVFKSIINDNELFIPAAGYYGESSLELIKSESHAYVWTSSLHLNGDPTCAYSFHFSKDNFYVASCGRYIGATIRPILLNKNIL